MTKSDFVKHSYSANCHFLQNVFNETKSRTIDSLHRLIASGVLKTATAENIAGSGLNLHHLQLIWQRDSGDSFLNVLSAKNSLDKPSVTKDKRSLGNIIPKLCCYFQEYNGFYILFCWMVYITHEKICVFFFRVYHIHVLARSIDKCIRIIRDP